MFSWFLGWKRTRPDRTASLAGFASSSMRMNHWSEMSGSIRSPERSQCPTSCSYGSSLRRRPWANRASRTFSRASATGRPANSPASSVMRPSKPIAASSASPCLRPISKSFRSWPGVTLRAPVPKSIFTYSSAMIGTSRSTNGTIAVPPTRCL